MFSTFIELIIITIIVLIQAPFAIFSIIPCGFFYYKIQKIFKASNNSPRQQDPEMKKPLERGPVKHKVDGSIAKHLLLEFAALLRFE